MFPTPSSASRHWDGSPRSTRHPHPLRVADTSPSRLLRAGRSDRCRQCGNRIDPYRRADGRPIVLHPAELAATDISASCRWHLSCGIAHPHGDGTDWCRIPHAVLCPHHTLTCRAAPGLKAIRRQLALRTRRMIDTGTFTPTPTATSQPAADVGEPDRPVVQLLHCRYLAERPVKDLRCVAHSRHRHRCTQSVLTQNSPPAAGGCCLPAPSPWPTRPAGHDGPLRPQPPALRRATTLARPALPHACRRPRRR
ncbi:DUF6083 domain-containing protein [Streptomyces sp. NPDC090088]|uniref:DUF6083 domain-containing protein n=1 Tax=Streptomyces sp. NPDC090088 TaxID=3365944 RepID=UPI0037FF46D2